tara:strand:+ start:2144 stop:2257 length:114 start_codon:yes stop_codon:yes gene_type:complete
MFVKDYPEKGQIYASEYVLCFEAASASSGAELLVKNE